jgi:hypothetical protein
VGIKAFSETALTNLGQRSTFTIWLMNVSYFVYGAIRSLPSRYQDGNRAYSKQSTAVANPNSVPYNDLALNFFLRVAREDDYSFIVELGSFSTERTVHLKKLIPDKIIYAPDIGPDFAVERQLGDITLAPNNLATIKTISARHGGRGLFCACHTLSYHSPRELADLFSLAYALRCDMAFAESNASLTEKWPRPSFPRSVISYYHPYISMLRSVGYDLPDNNGQQAPGYWRAFGEEWTLIFARYQ